jgi:hypothetical protein
MLPIDFILQKIQVPDTMGRGDQIFQDNNEPGREKGNPP